MHARGSSPSAFAGWVVSSGAKERGEREPGEASSPPREGGGCVWSKDSSGPKAPRASSLRGRSGAHGEREVPPCVPAPLSPPSLQPGPALRCPGPAGRSVPDPGRAAGLASLGQPSASVSPVVEGGSVAGWRRDTCKHR